MHRPQTFLVDLIFFDRDRLDAHRNNVDIFLGIGGGPEGVLAASALDSYDCFFQGRFLFETDKDKLRAKSQSKRSLYQTRTARSRAVSLPHINGKKKKSK